MPESDQPAPVAFNRPSARPGMSAMPVQRGNYGIPPRQATPQPITAAQPGPRMMDVAAPRPIAPTVPLTAPVNVAAPAPASAAPSQPVAPAVVPTMAADVTAGPVAARPLFNTAAPVQPVAKTPKRGSLYTKARLVLLIVGALITLAGVARWATAGSIANDTIAVGAVSANDGSNITIQFTADDGQLHKYNVHGKQPKLIPGSAVQVAYQAGAADKTVKQVSVVQNAHNLGVSLFFTGVALFVVAGGLSAFVTMRRRKHTSPLIEHAAPVVV